MNDVRIQLEVNGVAYERTVPARTSLADFLREHLGLTGTHLGCEHGACGACTVLVDGRGTRSCLTLAAQASGTAVRTVEGLGAADGGLSPLQRALSRHHGLQCGFCTPGVVVAATEVLDEHADGELDEAMVREALAGNVCRCTGYHGIVAAVLEAARDRQSQSRTEAA